MGKIKYLLKDTLTKKCQSQIWKQVYLDVCRQPLGHHILLLNSYFWSHSRGLHKGTNFESDILHKAAVMVKLIFQGQMKF